MPYELAWEPRGLYRRYFGFVTGEEFVQGLVETQADPRFDRLRYAITDYSDVEGHSVQEEHLARAAAMQFGAFHSNPNIMAAMVVTSPGILEGLEQFNGAGGTPYRIRVFTSLAAARLYAEQDSGVRLLAARPR